MLIRERIRRAHLKQVFELNLGVLQVWVLSNALGRPPMRLHQGQVLLVGEHPLPGLVLDCLADSERRLKLSYLHVPHVLRRELRQRLQH